MAGIHFRLKSDKKPGGMRISAERHVAYINREDEFADVDRLQEMGPAQSYRDTISGERPITKLPQKPVLLYSSPYGKINLDRNGVHVSRGASPMTAAIALSVAQKIYGDEVSVDGSKAFEKNVLGGSIGLELDVHFTNIDMEIVNEKLAREREADERERRFLEGGSGSLGGRLRYRGDADGGDGRGGRGGRVRGIGGIPPLSGDGNVVVPGGDADGPLVATVKPDFAVLAEASPATRSHLHALSSRRVAGKGRRRTPQLVRRNEAVRLLIERRRQDPRLDVRPSLPARQREAVKNTVDKILSLMQRNTSGDFAFAHVEYINREAAFAKRGGCVMTGSRLPKWAKGSPNRFFHMADRYERANGERYKEIVFSLPNELPIEKSKVILDRFLEKHFKDHYYTWAIHEKIGSMSSGERHPHVHLMFSTREIDALERFHERTPEMFFHRAYSENPERGGCKKAEKWNGKNRAKFLFSLREDFARIENEVLEENHVPTRVSHLSLEAQKMNAEARGDFVLAEILDRVPEKSMNPTAIVNDAEEVRRVKQQRLMNNRRLNAITKRELTKDARKEQDCIAILSHAEKLATRFQDEPLDDLPTEDRERILRIREQMEAAKKEAETIKTTVLWGDKAVEAARLDFMEADGRELWDETMTLRKDLREAKDFLDMTMMADREGISDDEDFALAELEEESRKRVYFLEKDYAASAKKLQPFLKPKDPGYQKKVNYRIHEYLFENEMAKARYHKRLREYEKSAMMLKREIENARARQAMEHDAMTMKDELIMTLAEARSILEAAHGCLGRTIRQKERELKEAQKAAFSYDRIYKMAANVFLRGDIKRLRERERALRKLEARYEAGVKEAQDYFDNHFSFDKLDEMKARNDRLDAMLNKITDEHDACREARASIEKRLDPPEAMEKVRRIAYGIMKKNQPAVRRVQKITQELRALEADYEANGKRVTAARVATKGNRGEEKIRVVPPKGSSGPPTPAESARTIGDKLVDDMQRGALVLPDDRKREKMDENWELMDEMDKEEEREERSMGRGR